jgi:hypothetical protein
MGLETNQDEVVAASRSKSQESAAAMEKAKAIIADKLATGDVAADESKGGKSPLRAFIAPVEKNTRYLIGAGKINQIVDPNSPTGKRDTFRDDEVWVEFHDGLVVLTPGEHDKQIEWCESNPETCRDIQDPLTEAWAFMKEAQQNLAGREAVLPQSLNVDAALSGRPGGVAHGGVQRAREHLANS